MIWLWRTACFDFIGNSIQNHSVVSGATATAATGAMLMAMPQYGPWIGVASARGWRRRRGVADRWLPYPLSRFRDAAPSNAQDWIGLADEFDGLS
eukprot:COSAG02_NODE_100_length_36897_cov_9.681749_7_plen_95_part_00